ncbi:MAG: hypothetical protein KGM15_10430 [Pseudomonadota bacterium]|nr:hypothetical protein [Pseudomonadota bacterium]
MAKTKWARLRGLGGACALAFCTPAFAGDAPANDAGTKAIADFLAAYLGKAALPSVKITAEGSSYLVSFDLGAATAALKGAGVVYDPATMTLRVFQQDDGEWRVEMASFPPISAHSDAPAKAGGGKIDIKVETVNFAQTVWLDPKLNWIGSIKGGADKLSATERGPGIEEFFEFGKLKVESSTKSAASGLTFDVDEPFASLNFVVDIDPKGVDPTMKGDGKPVHVSAQGEGGKVAISFKDFQPAPLLDAWKFAVAHPQRADLAHDAEALKSVVTALVADHFTLNEAFSLDKLNVASGVGPVAVEGAAFGAEIVNGGAQSGFAEHFAARAIKLPDGLLPPMYAPLTPTSFEIGFKATGFDVEAAAQEWLADAKFDGDGPVLSQEDQAKVTAKLLGAKPIVVDVGPAHIGAPSLNLTFEGKVTVVGSKPTGAITVKMSQVEKTIQALQGMGPEAQKQLVPVIAMVKGLGKPGADGALVWVCELGQDHVMKVNGLPLGKAPF